MTPLCIEILLHYHCRADDYRNGDHSAPAVKDALDWFLSNDVIRHEGFRPERFEDGTLKARFALRAIREDGERFYAESSECDLEAASPWVKENVLPHLNGFGVSRARIAADLLWFAGEKPEFWAYYADYDWVALCQLFGTMMDLPKGWPMYCRDVKQLCDSLGNPPLIKQTEGPEHNALADAVWTRAAWEFLQRTHSPQESE